MTKLINSNVESGQRSIRFAVVGMRRSGKVHLDDFSTMDRAHIALASNMDRAPLKVECAEVCRANNGNIRLWQSSEIEVLVDVVNPSDDFIGDDDIETVPAFLNLQSGEIRLASPKRGYPLMNWQDTGVNIIFHGHLYHACRLVDNVPDEIWGDAITAFLRETGYTVTIDLSTLEKSGIARQH